MRQPRAIIWPNENPVGKRIVTGLRDLYDCEVVGIVNNIKTESLRGDEQPIVYLPFPLNTNAHVTLNVRTAGDPAPTTDRSLTATSSRCVWMEVEYAVDRQPMEDALLAFQPKSK